MAEKVGNDACGKQNSACSAASKMDAKKPLKHERWRLLKAADEGGNKSHPPSDWVEKKKNGTFPWMRSQDIHQQEGGTEPLIEKKEKNSNSDSKLKKELIGGEATQNSQGQAKTVLLQEKAKKKKRIFRPT